MEKINDLIDQIYENSNSFVRSHTKSAKLEIYERIVNLLSSGVSAGIVITLGMLTLFFVNFGLAYWIGDLIESRSLGYVIVGGFYLIALLVYLLLRNRVAQNIVKDSILKKISKDHDDFDKLLEEQAELEVTIENNLHLLKENVTDLKEVVVGKFTQGSEKSTLPRDMVTSSVDFVLQNVIFKKGGFLTRTVLPVVANTFLTSALYKEGKGRSLFENIKTKLMKRFRGKAG